MKLTIERASLLRALGHVQSVVERRNTIPILSNALLTAIEGQVTLTTTDLDMEIAEWAPARVEEAGEVSASAHTLYEIVRELPDGAEVSLRYTGEDPRLEVRAGRSCFNLPVLPAGDFPLMPADGLSAPVAIETEALIRLIDRTRFAICTEETRYYLNGLYLHAVVEDGVPRLRAAATDTRRLAVAEILAQAGFAEGEGVIIPRKTVGEARRLLDDAGETVTLALSSQKVRLGFAHAALTSKVIDGSFPAYARLIPRENSRVMMVDNTLFAAAVRRVATVATDLTRAVGLAVEAGRMTLNVRNIDAGQAVETLEVDYDEEPFEVSFNARYILDVAAQISGELVQFRFLERASGTASQDPVLVLDPVDDGVQYVLMPLRA